MKLQPLLHDLLVAASAPTQAWSGADGQIRNEGAQGVYDADTRVLSAAVLTVGGVEPEVLAAGPRGGAAVEILAVLRTLVEDGGADPSVRLRRHRVVSPGLVRETLELTSAAPREVVVPLALTLSCDMTDMDHIKAGGAGEPLAASAREDGALVWLHDGDRIEVTAGGEGGAAHPPVSVDLRTPVQPRLAWTVVVRPGERVTLWWEVRTTMVAAAVVQPPPAGPTWSTPTITCDDRRLPALVTQALSDLAGLRMSASFAPDDVFLAAGAPWFFTLFGRDSLWAARMLLPLGTDLAAGTLRTLALRQGTQVDPETAEQPGKILHEVRAKPLSLGDHGVLPPLYYGTVDATPLWVCLLRDAWRWGMPVHEVEDLLPAMEQALGWMADYGDADGDGFLEYLDTTGHGLANQGWKDSGDSVQWRDGSLATGPIALCEVQGYAHEAALAGAEILEAFGRPGADRWRAWAADLATRFRAAFWVTDDEGAYPAIALDADKRAVDSLTSNIGHLLGTGLLTAEEESLVAGRLASPTLDSGYGLRTMSTASAGYWPMSYHGGAVWTHDTAIAVSGLIRSGHADAAASLLEGLLVAAADFGYRLPELHSGDARGSTAAAVPYPAACRPQAWSAASAVALLTSALGLDADVPGGTVTVRPITAASVGALKVQGLRIARETLEVEVDGAGTVQSVRTQAQVRIVL